MTNSSADSQGLVILGLLALLIAPFIYALWIRNRPEPIVAAAPQRPVPESAGAERSSNGISPYFLALVAIGGAYYWWSSQPSFSDDDIRQISANIKKKFEEERKVYVRDVSLVRETSNKLTGFVRLKIEGLAQEITKDCTATRDEKSTIWHCR